MVDSFPSLTKIEDQISKNPNDANAWTMKGKFLLKETKLYDALGCFIKSIIIEPTNLEAWEGKGIVSLLQNVRNDALQCFDKIIYLNKNSVNAWRLKSHAFSWNKANLKKINKCIDTALDLDSQNIDILTSKALLCKKERKTKESLFYWEKILKIKSDDLVSILNKNKLLKKTGNQNSVNCFKEVTGKDGDDINELKNIGNQLLLRFDFDNAEEFYNQILSINALDAEILFKNGLISLFHNNINSAIDLFSKSLDINPNDTEAWTRKGEILRRQNKIVQSIECFDKAIKLDEKNREAWRRKAFTQSMRHEKIDTLLSYLDKSLKLDPYHPMTLVQKSLFIRRDSSRLKEGMNCLDQALEIDPTFVLGWQIKRDIYISNNDFESASICCKNILKIDPDDAVNWYNTGVALAKKAEMNFQQALKFMNKSNFVKAVEYFDKVLETDPHDDKALLNKGEALLKLNKKNEALMSFKKASELDEENQEILTKIENLTKT